MDSATPTTSSAAPVRRAEPTAFSEVHFSLGSKRSSLPLGWIAGVAVVAVAAAAVWHFGLLSSFGHGNAGTGGTGSTVVLPSPAGGNGSTGASATGGSAPETLQNTSVPLISVPSSTPPETTGPAAQGAGAQPAGTAPAPAVTNAMTVTAPGAAPAAAPNTAPAAATAAAPAAAAGANALVLTMRQDSWISVTPAAGGKPLLSRLAKAGTTETINVDGPLKLVVGNAPGVSATLRGAPVALPGQTARISVK